MLDDKKVRKKMKASSQNVEFISAKLSGVKQEKVNG